MRNVQSVIRILFLFSWFGAFGQSDNMDQNQRAYLEQLINESLTNGAVHNVIKENHILIKDSLTAVNIAEAILFETYGKKNIEKQKPYSVIHHRNYWVLIGTLENSTIENGGVSLVFGGTFLIILDDRDGRVIRMTHGK